MSKKRADAKSATTKAALTGAAWSDKPVKADGMTSAEEQTNRTPKRQ
ncbi:hypothetical protein MO973_20420 [Paenibacillus sp. TRM 82003]|nr:hypothetical protein [Paenibacillus sp. TRM 82003]